MWGKLSHDELERTKGNLSAIAGLIQQKYGETKEAVTEKLGRIMGDKSEQAKEALRGDGDEEPAGDRETEQH
jgi:uncharacterized protein YjbJ (UPF0337 family)